MDKSRELSTRDIQSTNEGDGTSPGGDTSSPDAILSAVANDHRRAILHALATAAEKTLAYDVLEDRVADRVRHDGVSPNSAEHRQRVRITLHHVHLPKLEKVGIIDYEAETGDIQFVGGDLENDLLTLVESYETVE